MSYVFKIIAIIKERRLLLFIKEHIRFKVYIPAIRRLNLIIDKYYGINTEVLLSLSDLGLNDKLGNNQESTPIKHLKKIFSFLHFKSNDVLVDMGSGSGRVMLVAGRFPFEKIIGVDISEQLNKLCEKNIKKMLPYLKCKKFKNVTVSASNYIIPDEATHIYFFNPFGIDVMDLVLKSIFKSIVNYPRKVIIIWYNPKFEEELEKLFPLKRINEIHWNNFGLYDSRCIFYEI